MEYVIGLFANRADADRSIQALKDTGAAYRDASVKDVEDTVTVKGWLERLFGMPEPHSTLEAHGVPHEASQWLQDQIEKGHAMVVIRTERDSQRIQEVLQSGGAEDVRAYAWQPTAGV